MPEAYFKVADAYVELVADDTDLRSSLAAKIAAAAEGLELRLRVAADDAGLREDVAAKAAEAGADEKIDVHVKADAAGLAEEVKAEAEAIGETGEIKIPVEAELNAEPLRTRLRSIGQDVGADAEAAGAEIGDKLANGLWTDADGRLRNAQGRFASDAEKLAAGLDVVGKKSDETKQQLDGFAGVIDRIRSMFSDLNQKMGGVSGAASSVGGVFSALASTTGMMVGAVITLGPALAALPAAFGGLGSAVGALAGAFIPVIGALKDYGAQSSSAGQSSAQLALTAFSNAVAVRNAEQAIADAKVAAAQAAKSSADQIVAAQQQVVSATYGVQQAEQSYTNSLYDEQQAQQAVTQARADATNQIADARNAAADADLAAQQAASNLTKAQTALTQAQDNGMTTPQQLADAKLALAQAEQGVTDAQQRSKEATEKANQAQQDGVDKAPAVLNAQHSAEMAAEQVAGAQHDVTQALQDQQNAQNSLAKADAAAAAQRIASAQQVQRAEQALSDLLTQQRLAAAAAASAGGGAVDKFAQDMAKLTQPGRDFVNELLSVKTQLGEISRTAQTTMLPGLTQMLKDSAPLLPIFNTSVGEAGRVIGGLGEQVGNLIKNPAFQSAIAGILHEGVGLLQQFGSGFADALNGIAEAGQAASPIVSAIGQGLHDILASGLPDFLNGLTINAGGAGEAIQAILDLVSNLLGPLGAIVGALSGALGPALKTIVPPLTEFVNKLLAALLPMMPSLTTALLALANVFNAVLQVLEPLLPIIAQGLTGALEILAPILNGIAGFLQDNVGWLKWVALALLGLISPVGLVIVAVGYLWDHLSDLKVFIGIMVAEVQRIFSEGWGFVKGVFDDFTGFIVRWWPEILAPFTGGISLIIGHWNDIVSFIGKLPGRLATAGAHLWDWVKTGLSDIAGTVEGIFKSTINTIIGGINWVIDKTNDVTHGLSDIWSWAGIPGIPNLGHISPWMADGGTATTSGVAIVGEKGPELAFLNRGDTIMPLPAATTAQKTRATPLGPNVTINYNGTQRPTVEQQADMMRQLALAVS
jgi:phage-related protein